MKKSVFSLGLAALAMLVASCGKQEQAGGTEAGDVARTLHIYNWGDYLSEDVVKKFEEEFHCTVKVDVFDSNEAMYAKLKAGASGYDIIVPSSYMACVMNEQGMLEKLDHARMPNVRAHFDTSYASLALDPTQEYTVPYFVSFTGIGYDVTKVKDFEPTWHMFEKANLKGQVALLDDQRELLGCALRTLGYDVNSIDAKQIDEAVALAKVWKKNIAKFGVDDLKMSLASGEFALIQNYSGDMAQVRMENDNIRFVIPKEGSTCTFDNLAIMKNSKNKELAYQFINFIYDTENAVANMNDIMYVMPHKEAVNQVDEKLRNVFQVSPEDRARCQMLRDLGDKNVLYNQAWDKIKMAD